LFILHFSFFIINSHKRRCAINTQDSRFDPKWRDDVCEPQVIDIPLIFPADTSPNGEIWIKSRVEMNELVFKEQYHHNQPRWIKAILKRSDLIPHYQATDKNGNVIPQEHPLYDLMFKPKAWMTDSMEERCMMFAAAKQARGKVLVAGLGLAIYPQLVFYQQRPIQSLTVLENNAAVIELVWDVWLNSLNDEQKQKLTIIEGTIESFLQETSESFDTIYFDTWEDADPRFLPHINYLIQLGLPKCTPTGQIQCWGYALMVDTFVEHALTYVQKEFPLEDFHLDPGLERYSEWLQEHKDNKPSEETLKTVAREIALTTVKSLAEYDRNYCFTPFAPTYSEAHLNMARSRKRQE
jgi:hypothetical protein